MIVSNNRIQMHTQIVLLVNDLLEALPSVFLLGVLIAVLLELPVALRFVVTVAKAEKRCTKRQLLTLLPIGRRLLYVFGGLLVVAFSWATVNAVILTIDPRIPPIRALDAGGPWWDAALYPLAQYHTSTALVSVILLMFSGVALMLSGGDRWMTGLSKLLAVLAFGHIFVTIFALALYAAPAA